MGNLKRGVKTLVIYVLIAVMYMIAASIGYSMLYQTLVHLVASILAILLWYSAISKATTRNFKDGINTSLYFIVPYMLLSVWSYKAFVNNHLSEGDLIMKYLTWTLLSAPFILNAEGHILITMLQPLLFISTVLGIKYFAYKRSKV